MTEVLGLEDKRAISEEASRAKLAEVLGVLKRGTFRVILRKEILIDGKCYQADYFYPWNQKLTASSSSKLEMSLACTDTILRTSCFIPLRHSSHSWSASYSRSSLHLGFTNEHLTSLQPTSNLLSRSREKSSSRTLKQSLSSDSTRASSYCDLSRTFPIQLTTGIQPLTNSIVRSYTFHLSRVSPHYTSFLREAHSENSADPTSTT